MRGMLQLYYLISTGKLLMNFWNDVTVTSSYHIKLGVQIFKILIFEIKIWFLDSIKNCKTWEFCLLVVFYRSMISSCYPNFPNCSKKAWTSFILDGWTSKEMMRISYLDNAVFQPSIIELIFLGDVNLDSKQV